MSGPKLRNFTKALLQLEASSFSEYSAPDSPQYDSARLRRNTPTKIKYDYWDLKIARRHDDEELIYDPSYTNRKTYSIVCALRRQRNFRRYNKQFDHEIQQLIKFQPTALETEVLLRAMSYTSLWPPFHSHEEINYTMQYRVPRSRKHVEQLRRLLATDIK
uniref:Uncharacterized protein n=1 Tax=Glossina brevipalpis TaxID=37001 RepID=A0A1A9W1F3_9MUSC